MSFVPFVSLITISFIGYYELESRTSLQLAGANNSDALFWKDLAVFDINVVKL